MDLLKNYITIFIIDDSVKSPRDWAEMKRIVMKSADYILNGRYGQLKLSFLTSPSRLHPIFEKRHLASSLQKKFRGSRLASPYQRIADILGSHIDTLEGLDNARPRTYKGLNVVTFLNAKKESSLDVDFSAIVHRNRALSAAKIDVGVQFVYMQQDGKDASHSLELFVLVAGREKRIVSKVRLPLDPPRSDLMLIIACTR